MAYGANNTPYSAAELIALKTKVRNEMNRRKYNGSMAAYGTAYTDTPADSKVISVKHVNEIVNPLLAVNSSVNTIFTITENEKYPDLSLANTHVDNLSKKAVTASDHGCSALCSGLCSSNCGGSCSGGCSDTCRGGLYWKLWR